jgi:hypothetical protein
MRFVSIPAPIDRTRRERPNGKKLRDTLRTEGEFEGSPRSRDDCIPMNWSVPKLSSQLITFALKGSSNELQVQEMIISLLQVIGLKVKRPQDNLRLEGNFEGMSWPRDDFKRTHCEGANIKKPADNLGPEEELEGTPASKDDLQPTRKFRADICKPKNNLRPEGEFERPQPQQCEPGDRTHITRYPDNLRLQGDLYRPQPKEIGQGERPGVEKPRYKLKPEGEFKGISMKGVCAVIKKPIVNLRSREHFEGTPRSRDDYQLAREDRAEGMRHEDNFRPEGNFEGRSWTRDDFKPTPGDVANIKKPIENLPPEE